MSGFYFNYTSVKIEICDQTSKVVSHNEVPFFDSGIAAIVTSFSSDSKKRMQEQIYEISILANTLYIMYCNRMEALRKSDELERVKKSGVWSLFLEYGKNKHSDYILKTTYELLKESWSLFYRVQSLYESRNLKQWSFLYTNNVCSVRNNLSDLTAFISLLGAVASIIMIAAGIWINENIIQSIVYE